MVDITKLEACKEPTLRAKLDLLIELVNKWDSEGEFFVLGVDDMPCALMGFHLMSCFHPSVGTRQGGGERLETPCKHLARLTISQLYSVLEYIAMEGDPDVTGELVEEARGAGHFTYDWAELVCLEKRAYMFNFFTELEWDHVGKHHKGLMGLAVPNGRDLGVLGRFVGHSYTMRNLISEQPSSLERKRMENVCEGLARMRGGCRRGERMVEMRDENKAKETKSSITQEFLVLGRQPLTVLRDKIYCLTDQLMQKAEQHVPSGYFLIENVFYNDLRDPMAIDYSSPIIDWVRNKKDEALEKWKAITAAGFKKKQRALLQSSSQFDRLPFFRAVDMAATCFADLRFRLGIRYLYCHQGDCTHGIVIRDMRLIHPEDVQNKAAYPLLTFQPRVRHRKCTICDIYRAKKREASPSHNRRSLIASLLYTKGSSGIAIKAESLKCYCYNHRAMTGNHNYCDQRPNLRRPRPPQLKNRIAMTRATMTGAMVAWLQFWTKRKEVFMEKCLWVSIIILLHQSG
eukprot:Gb_05446 [translate_table: standard]